MDILSYAAATKRIDALRDNVPQKFIPGGAVAITFDDGFLENYIIAHPLLKARGIPATMFACTDWVTGPNAGVSGWCNLTQLLDLQSEGWEIGSHSKTHTNLSTLTDAQVRDELSISKQVLEGAGLDVTTFGVPFGALPNDVDLLFEYYEHVAQSVGAATTLPPNHRCFYRYWPNNEQGTTVEDVKMLIEIAEKRGAVVVLGFHRFGEDISGNAWPQSYFEELINWLDPNKCFTFREVAQSKVDPSKRLINKAHYALGRCDGGSSTGGIVFTVNDGWGWDYNDRSLGVDLFSPRQLKSIRVKCVDSVVPRMSTDFIDVWYSDNNITFSKYNGKYELVNYLDNKNEDNKRTLLLNLQDTPKARYWKIHQKFNDTEFLTKVEFTNQFCDVWVNQSSIALSL